MDESSLENEVLDRRKSYEMKFFNCIRMRNAHNIIPSLSVKLEKDLILNILFLCISSYECVPVVLYKEKRINFDQNNFVIVLL